MSWKSFACVAALGALASPAVAQPSIALTDNMDGTATLSVTPGSGGTLVNPSSLAVELDIVGSGGITLGAPTIADSLVWDEANPGDNPFIAGSPIGGDSTGIWVDPMDVNNIFASYGSDVVSAASDFLTIPYSGTGTITVGGLADIVAQSVTTTPPSEVFNVGMVDLVIDDGGPTLLADFDMDGDVDGDDFGVFVGEFNQGTVPPAAGLADFDGDNDIDGDDFGVFVGEFNMFPSTSAAVPEPASVAVAALAMLAAAAGRRHV